VNVAAVLIERSDGEILRIKRFRQMAECIERVAHITEFAEEEDDEGVDVVRLDNERDESRELGRHGLVAHPSQNFLADLQDEVLLREKKRDQLAHFVGLVIARDTAAF